MNNNSVLTHSFGNSIIQQRESDGYINATAMCKATGKLWAHYMENGSTKEFLQELSLTIGIPIIKNSNCPSQGQLELIQSETGRYGGTWIHPYIAINLAQWCSAAFAVQVSKWVIDWFEGAQNPITQQPDPLRELELKIKILDFVDRHGLSTMQAALGISPTSAPYSSAPTQPCETAPSTPSPREKAQLKAKAWVEILETRDRWAAQNSYDVFASDLHFSDAYNERRIYIGAWVYEFVPHISRSTVARRRIKNKQVEVQLDKTGAGRPLLIDTKYPAVAAFIAKCLESSSSTCLPGLMKLIEVEFKGLDLPCEATIRRYLAHRKASIH
jgi:hypothetical protein